MMAQNTISYKYKITCVDENHIEFNIILDEASLDLIQSPRENYPSWAKLDFFQCPCCPLEKKTHQFCPAAIGLVGIIEVFKDAISCDEVELVVETSARNYVRSKVSMQKVVSSLIGIYMATSGCPILEKLKPMVKYHLPLATAEETSYRVLSMYLLAQYFIAKQGKNPDWELKKLAKTYEDIRIVNENFSHRLRSTDIEDASLNAVVILDIFAMAVLFSLGEEPIKDIGKAFKAYLK